MNSFLKEYENKINGYGAKYLKTHIHSRLKQTVESFLNAGLNTRPVAAGKSLFDITRGLCSMIVTALHVLNCTVASGLSIRAGALAKYEILALTRLRLYKRLSECLLILDGGVSGRKHVLIHEWSSMFGPDSVRRIFCHAKIAALQKIRHVRSAGILRKKEGN